MTFVVSCIYYQDSKCMLKGNCCDLNCDMADSDRGQPFADEIDPITKWEIERGKKVENIARKLS